MRVLVVGGGGREHALAWAWHRDAPSDDIVVAPGNGGTVAFADNVAVDVTDAAAVARCARDHDAAIVVIGPDAAAAAGVADACTAEGIAVFGPGAAAARIESSKVFAKQVMQRAAIPTARWVAGDASGRERLRDFVLETGGRCVVKADGLALGKGVVVCDSTDEALQAIAACFDERRFGSAGGTVVVEERLEGVELSVFGISDGERIRVLPPARDHKRAFDGEVGPNTGGMGAVSPPPDRGIERVVGDVRTTVLQPCVDTLRDMGCPFVGCLYAGLMLTDSGPRVLEFNARFGDPEAQVVLPLVSESVPDLLVAAAHGELEAGPVATRDGVCAGVVAAAAGYPGSVRSGDEITGLDALDESVLCFHAGTRVAGGRLLTAGGRVLCLVAHGATVHDATEDAYANLARVRFDGMWYRRDIGATGLATVTS